MTHRIASVLVAGLVVGALDAFAATALASLNGVAPLRVWQFVAAGALGPRAFQEGRKSAFLGLLLHFFIALCVTATFVIAAHVFPWLVASPILVGTIYGVLIFVAMQIVVRISAAPKGEPKLSQVLGQVAIHIFVIGIPIAAMTKHYLL